MRNVDKLQREVMKLDLGIIVQVLPFVEALRKFDKVVSSCFSQILDPDYETHIKDFSSHYRSLNISVTPKVNILSFNFFQCLIAIV